MNKKQKYEYQTQGICAEKISFEIAENCLKNVVFTRGCDGNLKGLSALVEGLAVDEVIKRLSGIKCGQRETSCPDQLAQGLKELMNSRL